MRPIVTILCSKLDGTPVIRDHALARMLQDRFDVHIVGFSQSGEVWGPLANEPGMDYRPFRAPTAWKLWTSVPGLEKAIEGRVLYATKPRNTSFGLGLLARRRFGVPLALDVDDWEMAFLFESIYWEIRTHGLGWFRDPLSPLYTRILDRMVHRADAVTVTTSFLQDKYGGEWIPHTRDAEDFHPPTKDVGGPPRVVFLGAVRPHKGLSGLLEAWSKCERGDAELHLIGTPPDSEHLRGLPVPDDGSVHFTGLVPFREVPDHLRKASLVVIPQLDERSSVGQLPTKLIEAMAVGRAVVTTGISDIPLWMHGCGVLVPPGDTDALARAIGGLLADPAERDRLGRAARLRFEQFASREAVKPRLIALFEALVDGRPLPAPVRPHQVLGEAPAMPGLDERPAAAPEEARRRA